MEKQLNISHNTRNAGVFPKSDLGCCKIALILLLLITCISFAGCTDTLDTTNPTSESVATEIPGNVTEPQIPDETDMATEPVTEETVPFEMESTPTETTHVHSYTSKVIAPTCTEGGYTTFTCGCGDAYTADQTDATGHNYRDQVISPTCTENGYTTYTCSVCGDSYTGSKTNATGHSWGSWKVTTEPTATSEGAEQRTCKTCGNIDSRSIAKLPEETKSAYETFSGTIGSYNAHNLAYTDWKGDTEQAAYIEIYTVEKNDEVLNALAVEFEKVYGFAPSLGDKYRCTSSCEKMGTYMVAGYEEPQTVYHYSITDKTYIYITNPMYEVYVQECADGSVWVGYCIYATMDTIGAERSKAEVQALDQEMYATFAELIGVDQDKLYLHKEEFDLKIGYISEAGTVRSVHSDKPVQVLYIYCRGFAHNDSND